MNLINFNNSFIKWVTKDEENRSTGVFFAESLLTVCRNGNTEDILLGSPVMAGNVYALNKIPKIPSYTFQIAASNQRHHIWRYGSLTYDGEMNSENKNREIFSDLKVIIHYQDYYELCVNEFRDQTSTITRIRYDYRNFNVEACFPNKHINIRDTPPFFQIETGPVILLLPGDEYPDRLDLSLAYVFFNSVNSIELLSLSAQDSVDATRCRFSKAERIGAEVKVYSMQSTGQ